MNDELNKKLAEFAHRSQMADAYTESLDACFKWLVPKLIEIEARVILEYSESGSYARIENALKEYDTSDLAEFYKLFGDVEFETIADIDKNPLALCLAIEKLIDSRED